MEAKKTKADKAEATLKVIVLDKKTVKVAIRPAQVRDGKQLVSLGNAADPKNLLGEMNAIWNVQANVYFERLMCEKVYFDMATLMRQLHA